MSIDVFCPPLWPSDHFLNYNIYIYVIKNYIVNERIAGINDKIINSLQFPSFKSLSKQIIPKNIPKS